MREAAACVEIGAANFPQFECLYSEPSTPPVLQKYSSVAHKISGAGRFRIPATEIRETVACAETVAVDFPQRERPYWGLPLA